MFATATRFAGGLRPAKRLRLRSSTPAISRTYAAIPAAPQNHEPDPQLNGYPELPNISRLYLPAKGWWDVQQRRNFGDTVSLRNPLFSSVLNFGC